MLSLFPIRRFGLLWLLQKSNPFCGNLPVIELLPWTLSNLSIPSSPFALTYAPFAHRWLKPTSTCFSILLPFGNGGATSFIWSILVGWYRATLYTTFFPGTPYQSAVLRGNYGFSACMPLFGRFWKKRSSLVFDNILGMFLCWECIL